jgi:mono/diheme cytochrome c family protein
MRLANGRSFFTAIAAAALLVRLLGGCGGDEAPAAPARESAAPTPSAPAAPRPDAGAAGAQLFAARCATCHGPAGDGRGPAAAGLSPAPRDLRDPAWQASVSDAHIEQVIAGGGPAVGLSPLMPAQPDLARDRARLESLRAHVRSLGR